MRLEIFRKEKRRPNPHGDGEHREPWGCKWAAEKRGVVGFGPKGQGGVWRGLPTGQGEWVFVGGLSGHGEGGWGSDNINTSQYFRPNDAQRIASTIADYLPGIGV